MVKAAVLFLALALLVLAGASPANAQCRAFSAGVTCSAAVKPAIRADFGAPKVAPKKPTPAARPAVPIVSAPADANAIDCAMIRPVDPKFHSNMPLVRPDPTVNLPMTMLHPPACRS